MIGNGEFLFKVLTNLAAVGQYFDLAINTVDTQALP